jgi:hypothetical protein
MRSVSSARGQEIFLLILDALGLNFKSNKLRGEYGSNNDASAGGVGKKDSTDTLTKQQNESDG